MTVYKKRSKQSKLQKNTPETKIHLNDSPNPASNSAPSPYIPGYENRSLPTLFSSFSQRPYHSQYTTLC
jgi:hypothetical protein